MRSEIGVTPYANYYMPYLNGEPLKDCRMADEELGCAEVYVRDAEGNRTRETRMVFGQIELRPYRNGVDPGRNPDDADTVQAQRDALDAELGPGGVGWQTERAAEKALQAASRAGRRCDACKKPFRKVCLPALTVETEWREDGPHIGTSERIEYWCGCHLGYNLIDD